MRKDLKGRGDALIEVMHRHSPGGTEKLHRILRRNIMYSGQDLNPATPEYESRALCYTNSFG
jgi:hypothetical protein